MSADPGLRCFGRQLKPTAAGFAELAVSVQEKVVFFFVYLTQEVPFLLGEGFLQFADQKCQGHLALALAFEVLSKVSVATVLEYICENGLQVVSLAVLLFSGAAAIARAD